MLQDWPKPPLAGGRGVVPAVSALLWAVTVAYPFLIWFLLDRFPARAVALALAALFLLRFWLQGPLANAGREKALAVLACVGFLLAAALVDREAWLLAYPVFVSLLFFAVFFASLFFPPTVVERLARLNEPDLPAQGVAYTRKVTQVWSGFFFANALVSLFTVYYGDRWWWSFYNGCLFYVLMGLLMLAEMAVRRRVRARD